MLSPLRLPPSIAVLVAILISGTAPADESSQLPGFELEEGLDPLPGFGKVDERYLVKVTDEDQRTVDERFRRYDRDRNGFLSREELSRNRWSEDPFRYDRNGDRQVSREEMAYRYANMRIAKEVGRQKGETDRLMKFYAELDRNRNQVLEPFEIRESRYRGTVEKRIREAGMDPNKPIPLRDFMQKRLKNAGVDSKRIRESVKYIPTAAPTNSSSRSNEEKKDEDAPKSYRIKTALERLPKDVPEWFREKDRNQDGRVSMAEYGGTKWTNELAAEFVKQDLNNDGMISPAESMGGKSDGDSKSSRYSKEPSGSKPKSKGGFHRKRR